MFLVKPQVHYGDTHIPRTIVMVYIYTLGKLRYMAVTVITPSCVTLSQTTCHVSIPTAIVTFKKLINNTLHMAVMTD